MKGNRQEMVKIGMCALNNDPLSFKNNYLNIMESIRRCKEMDCKVRVGAELEVSGYCCDDHFNEFDTTAHSWDVIGDILKSGITEGIICCLGSPIQHKGNIYNTIVILYNNKVVGIRPKMELADGQNYFQTRWFGNWKEKKQMCECKVPKRIQQITGQNTVPIGQFILDFNDTSIAFQICQEAWIANNNMIDASLDGAEIFLNPSGSHIERGKLTRKIQLIKEVTQKLGGSYCYVNIKGVVGERTYFDGGNIFCENGKLKALTELEVIDDIIVTPVICNLEAIRVFRLSNKSFLKQTFGKKRIPRIHIDVDIGVCDEEYPLQQAHQKAQLKRLIEVYEFPHATYEPSLFLWDYLRKSKGSGFFLALSGGLDSCSVALTVYNLSIILLREIHERKNAQVLKDLRKIVGEPEFKPDHPHQIMKKILFTAYLSTNNSSQQTRKRAKQIAQCIGSNHREVNFHPIYESFKELGEKTLDMNLNFKKEGGSWRTDLALQNIQARSRMLLTYLFAQTELQIPKRPGFLLVLGSSNLDESLRGYFTKYDCSAADINPIGSFSKIRLRQYLGWNEKTHKFKVISQVLNATPTAELQPLKQGQIAQTDEEDMGFSYAELHLFGKLRSLERLGPVSMFDRISNSGSQWKPDLLASKIKKFFRYYSINRHKMNTLTPSFHYNPQGCDDNRFDMRPIIYETDWSYQFQILEERVRQSNEQSAQKQKRL